MSQSVLGFLSRPGVWFGGLALATFLALYWVLRGAAPGRSVHEDEAGAPDAGRRERAVVATVVALILIMAGAYVATAYSVPWSLPLFGLGYGGLIAVIRANRPYRHSSPVLRRVIAFADTAMTASLLMGILVVGNVLAFKYGERPFDFTGERVHSLESLSIKQLRGLDRPVRFTAFFERGTRAGLQLDRVRQLLSLFKAENPKLVTVEVLHPFANPLEYEELKRRAPGVAVAPSGGVLIEYGGGDSAQRVVVRNAELFESEEGDYRGATESTFRGEDALISALVRLREGKKPKIGFVTGHGEPSVHDLDPNRPGLGHLRARLESIGSEVQVLNLAREAVPTDVDVVIVTSPRTAFQPAEVARLRGYVDAGGRALLMLDGRVKTGLEEWLKAENIEFDATAIVDPVNNFARNGLMPLAPILGDSQNPIVSTLLREAVIVPGATPIVIAGQTRSPAGEVKPANPTSVVEAILRTGPDSWAETEPSVRPVRMDPGKDRRGPFVVGVAITQGKASESLRKPGEPRLVVFSSPLLGDNWVVSKDEANLDLISNSVQWLRGRPDLQGITPRRHKALTLALDPGLQTRLVLIPTVMAFAVIIGLGVSTYLARRA